MRLDGQEFAAARAGQVPSYGTVLYSSETQQVSGATCSNDKSCSVGVARGGCPALYCTVQYCVVWYCTVQVEYTLAKRELQREIKNGVSLEDLRRRLTGGSEATAPPAAEEPPKPKVLRIKRKVWNPNDFLRRHHAHGGGGGGATSAGGGADADAELERSVVPLQKAAWAVEGALEGELLYRRTFPLEQHSLVVSKIVLFCRQNGNVLYY